jgi:acyl transferase domain-containing protein
MNEMLERLSKLSPKRLTLLVLELQAKLDRLSQPQREPIAIIGMGCRFPGGADHPQKFWHLLRDGIDAVGDLPAGRCDLDPRWRANTTGVERLTPSQGGYLEQVDQFDPLFFGILPGEATTMDPQQRLVLEVGWEALEDAGIAADRLAGSQTGIFIGVTSSDFGHILAGAGAESLGAHVASGSSLAVAAGRLSHVLGLNGPSMVLDTTCSSSLVAIATACDSLRAHRCGMALAGGVNVILSLEVSAILSQAGIMAPDGRCKAFDASADGFVRAEGCGIAVLKRLSDAQADGDRILAVIRGTAVNHDGRSGALTAPNGPAQRELIRQALEDAGLRPADIQYVEAHGTGTSLGDPIEMQALVAALGEGRPRDEPLLVGSVKTNLGHLESAAGVAGLFKTVLAIQHAEIPPHLHLKRANPHIDWANIPVSVPTQLTLWPARSGSRLAGVSSFGLSGTNAHVVIEEASVNDVVSAGPERPLHLLCLSARSEGALKDLVGRYRAYFEQEPSLELADACYTANVGRCHFSHRLTVLAKNSEEMSRRLGAVLTDTEDSGVHTTKLRSANVESREVVFVFTDHESPFTGQGRQLHATQPTFRAALERVKEALSRVPGGSAFAGSFDAILGSDTWGAPEPEQKIAARLIKFAIQYALNEMLRSWGIGPGPALGHGVGAHVAACVRGEVSLDVALERIVRHSSLSGSAPGRILERDVPGADLTFASLLHAIREPRSQSDRIYVEIGLEPLLSTNVDTLSSGTQSTFLPTLRRGHDDWATVLDTASHLYRMGIAVDWVGFDRDYRRRKVSLPTYPFERARYWPLTSPEPESGQEWREWLYDFRFEPEFLASAEPLSPDQRRRWLIFGDQGRRGHQLTTALEARGDHCTSVTNVPSDENDYDVRALTEFLEDDDGSPCGVVFMRALDAVTCADISAQDLIATQERACGGLLRIVQALAQSKVADPPTLTVITRGAQHVQDDVTSLQVAQIPIWGLCRTIALEHPELRCLRVDLDPRDVPHQTSALLEEIVRKERADEVVFRNGQRFIPRLVPSEERDQRGSAISVRSGACYLVSGGLTGLGLAAARRLVDRGARRLVLVGRRAASTEAQHAIEEIGRLGAAVEIIQADVSRAEDVERVFRQIQEGGVPLKGVIHCAGAMDYGLLAEQTWKRFENVMAGKVQGAWNLHRATVSSSLDFFIVYSSAASLLGSRGNASYSAANAFLDGLAHYRASLGLPGLTINWGPWSEIGLATSFVAPSAERWSTVNLGAIQPSQGLDILGCLAQSAHGQVAVLPGGWIRWLIQSLPSELMSWLLRTFPTSVASDQESRAPKTPELTTRLIAAGLDERRKLVKEVVQEAVSRVFLLNRPTPIGDDESLTSLGMDSLMAIQLSNHLKRVLGRHVTAMIALDHPTIGQIADRLLDVISSVPAPRLEIPTTASVAADSEPKDGWSPQRAQQALHTLDGLSDAEVEAMLQEIASLPSDGA